MRIVARQLDPRVRMLLWLVSMATGLVLPGGRFLAGYVGIILALVISVGALRAWSHFALRLVLPTLVMLVLVYGFLVPPSAPSATTRLWGVQLSASGIGLSLAIAGRLLAVGGATVAFFKTTPALELAAGLRGLGLPPSLAVVLLSSFTMYRHVQRKIRQIADSQRSRGVYPRGILVGRLRVYVPLLRPLLFGLILGAVNRSALWQARGFLEQTEIDNVNLKLRDKIGIVCAIVVVTLAGVIRWIALARS